MQIKEIDTLNAQPFQGGMAAAGDVVGLIIDGAGIGLVRRTLNATFGGDGEFQPFGLAQPGKKLAYQLLVVAAPVKVGGIDKGHIQVAQLAEQLQGMTVIGLTIKFAEPHRAITDSADLQTLS